jgi:ATP-dependent Lon protease
MYNDLTLEQINSLIFFQRRYRFLKSEIDNINVQLSFYQDCLMSMLSNLEFFNKVNIFSGTNSSFMIILEEIKEINDILIKIPNKILIKHLNDISLKKISLDLFKIYKLLLKYSNHISFENVNYILELFGGKSWIKDFNDEELDKILFLSRFFKPICIWDSEEHVKGIPFPNKTEPKKKNAVMAKDLLESILNTNSNKVSSIIVGDNNMPAFLQSINDLIESTPKKTRQRDNDFNKIECIGILDRDKIKITKNAKSACLFEDKFGACVYLKLGSKFLVIQGIFKDDILNISQNIEFVDKHFRQHKKAISYDLYDISKNFKNNYLKIINLRDMVACTSSEICDDIKKKFHDFKSIQGKPLLSLINEFLLASKYRKIDILTLLLMSNEDDQRLAYVLYDVLKSKDKKNQANEIYESLHYSIRELLESSEQLVTEDEEKLQKISSSDIPYERRISLMKTDEEVKGKAMEKLKSMKNSFQGDNKAQSWLDGLLKVPFGTVSKNEVLDFKSEFLEGLKVKNPDINLSSDIQITEYLNNNDIDTKTKENWEEYLVDRKSYLKLVREKLDDAVYGHKEAKTQLERIFAQWINGEAKGAVLGLQGPPGTGKTSLAKNGLSKCLVDKKGDPRPFAFLPIGGSVNGSTLVGHNFTYVGSTWGRIVDILITTKCMNPIIFIDEIDKVSMTEHGREIISILTHLTDATQNDEFEDKYFAGIKLDLSKALIVFSFNDPSVIDPILKDRITIIETNPLTLPEKVTIIQKYMLPDILKEVGLHESEIIMSDVIIRYLIETYTNEAGVRKIKEQIQEIVRDVNLNRFHDGEKYEVPFNVTKDYIKLLFENKPKVRVKKIADEPSVGLVNGLYATTTGIGGLTIIQVMKYPADKTLELSTTGKQGEVMKESVEYAKKIAFSLLTNEEQEKIIKDGHEKKGFGIHVHTPEAATPKDGPSAGAAMTLAMYSLMSGKKVNNKVAMTGEIDLCKRVTAIGGVDAKLNGAKRAGVIKALIPKENEEDLEKLRRDGLSPEGDDFEVVLIEHIDEVLKHAIVD